MEHQDLYISHLTDCVSGVEAAAEYDYIGGKLPTLISLQNAMSDMPVNL